MAPLSTEAIVIRTSPYSESTLLVWLLTREGGVVRALAKGARRIKGQNNAALDSLSVIQAGIRIPAREGLAILGSLELRHSWSYVRTDLDRLAFASVGIEILTAVATASGPDAFFFEQGVQFLSLLEGAEAPGSLTALLLILLLWHSGHPPTLSEDVRADESFAFDFRDGGIIGRANLPHGGGRYWPLSGELIGSLREVLSSCPRLEMKFVLPRSVGRECLDWLIRVWEDHLNQKFRSVEFLEKWTSDAVRQVKQEVADEN